jgi:hypothetical protein
MSYRQSSTITNRGSRIAIALPGGAPAELRLPDPITPEALKALVEWLGHAPQVPECDEAVVAQEQERFNRQQREDVIAQGRRAIVRQVVT